MTSRDLNSINEAYVQATTKVVTKEAGKTEEVVTEQFKDKASGTQFGPNDPDDPFNKDKDKKKKKDKKVEEAKRKGGRFSAASPKGEYDPDVTGELSRRPGVKTGPGAPGDDGGKMTQLTPDERRARPKGKAKPGRWRDHLRGPGSAKAKNQGNKWKEPKTEDIGPDFGDEEEFGDPSRHSGDYLDSEPLDVGDIVEVEGEDDDFVILGIDGDWVQAAVVGDGIEVKRDSVVRIDSDKPDEEVAQVPFESVKIERRLITLKEKKKIMKFTNIMAEYESRLSSSSKGFSLKSKLNEEDGVAFKQPDESIGVKVDKKSQRPTDETSGTDQESSTENVDDDLQEPKKEEEKNTKKEKKVVEDSINNSNKGNIMSQDKSIFDKLYEQVMGEDDEFELGLPGDDDLGGGDELGDELGGEEVTVTLTPDQVDALKAVVDQFPAPEDELGGGEDEFGGDEELPDEGFRRESADTVKEKDEVSSGKPTSDGTKPGVDPSDGGGKTTDPAADSLGGKSSGTGDAKVTDDAPTTGKDTGEGKKVGVAKNSGKPGKQKANAKI